MNTFIKSVILLSIVGCGGVDSNSNQLKDNADAGPPPPPALECDGSEGFWDSPSYTTFTDVEVEQGQLNKMTSKRMDLLLTDTVAYWNQSFPEQAECITNAVDTLKISLCDANVGHQYQQEYHQVQIGYSDGPGDVVNNTIHEVGHVILTQCWPEETNKSSELQHQVMAEIHLCDLEHLCLPHQ